MVHCLDLEHELEYVRHSGRAASAWISRSWPAGALNSRHNTGAARPHVVVSRAPGKPRNELPPFLFFNERLSAAASNLFCNVRTPPYPPGPVNPGSYSKWPACAARSLTPGPRTPHPERRIWRCPMSRLLVVGWASCRIRVLSSSGIGCISRSRRMLT